MTKRFTFGLKGKSALILGGLVSFALISTNLVGYLQSKNIVESKVIELEQSKSFGIKHEVDLALENHNQNLLFLRDVPPIQAIIRAPTTALPLKAVIPYKTGVNV